MSKGKKRERKGEGKGREGEIADRREVRVATGDDAGWPVSLGRKGEVDGGYGRKKKGGQSQYKKCSLLRVHKKDIIFHIKS